MVHIANSDSSSSGPMHGFAPGAIATPPKPTTPAGGNAFTQGPLISQTGTFVSKGGEQTQITQLYDTKHQPLLRVETSNRSEHVTVFDARTSELLIRFNENGVPDIQSLSAKFESSTAPAEKGVLTATLPSNVTIKVDPNWKSDKGKQSDLQSTVQSTFATDLKIRLPGQENPQQIVQQIEVGVLSNRKYGIDEDADQVRFINTLSVRGTDQKGKPTNSTVYQEAATVFSVDKKTVKHAEAVRTHITTEDPLGNFRDKHGIQKQSELYRGALVYGHKVVRPWDTTPLPK